MTDDTPQPAPEHGHVPLTDGDYESADMAKLRAELEQARELLRGVSISDSEHPLVCFKCGTPKNCVVYHYCHDCKEKSETAEAELEQLKQENERLYTKRFHPKVIEALDCIEKLQTNLADAEGRYEACYAELTKVQASNKELCHVLAMLRIGMPDCEPCDEDSDHCACAIDALIAKNGGGQ